jgi:hypothetical protein
MDVGNIDARIPFSVRLLCQRPVFFVRPRVRSLDALNTCITGVGLRNSHFVWVSRRKFFEPVHLLRRSEVQHSSALFCEIYYLLLSNRSLTSSSILRLN